MAQRMPFDFRICGLAKKLSTSGILEVVLQLEHLLSDCQTAPSSMLGNPFRSVKPAPCPGDPGQMCLRKKKTKNIGDYVVLSDCRTAPCIGLGATKLRTSGKSRTDVHAKGMTKSDYEVLPRCQTAQHVRLGASGSEDPERTCLRRR